MNELDCSIGQSKVDSHLELILARGWGKVRFFCWNLGFSLALGIGTIFPPLLILLPSLKGLIVKELCQVSMRMLVCI